MAKRSTKESTKKTVETLTHEADTRKNIPTAEYQSVVKPEAEHPIRVAYACRNRDLDPQLVGGGRMSRTWSDLDRACKHQGGLLSVVGRGQVGRW